MKIAIPKETFEDERRVPMIPADVDKLIKRGAEVVIESGMGKGSGYDDGEYTKVGAKVTTDRKTIMSEADIVLRLRKPPEKEILLLKKGAIHISYLDPFNEKEIIEKFKAAGVSAISMEMIPRTTRAQKMDALSSQASLAGYVAVVEAMKQLDKIFPMMMTPAGTIQPSRVFIIGAGVAGLQAIATAKRMGAKVEAFDTRPVVEEQVQSLGAKFVKVDLGETGQTKDGYAKALTDEQLKKQQEVMAKHCSMADVVITTAKLFGRKAPVIITKDMIQNMKKGSVIVDLAVDTGGNVEGSKLNETVNLDGVFVIGLENYPGQVPVHASQMYSSNLRNFIEEFWDDETKTFKLDLEDELIRGCLITHNHEIVNEALKPKSGG
ncbi:MAG: Re/Si-specific NAD(P)(+) transhydrogenase subunit alpha [Candidatus Aminicenantes bacterium]|nr:Re/Si-specific NAD(P)(+) transhydrogenase subunit alpha [Candidatus Aminicenantes bacterium]NIM78283.1 Re/Si-specific NAD(P)(+) transhydrogenase subunit alpha [Candidatus Aminicenantes bacterium]NIN19709.1 Re/Si-specific NAD(P)(+) transhydrogenase subunit alpha [Candidatus Aminicenantes bacterium]NIN43591.1 Re/Si-specific NAD(P)(+) transhydrogenase subunit alpha [Candidatus Aminicenantes bacterium]NIN86336.1 Re/Si-specific NAD(P)(+) transhydrogenase subunit alpha [Candidatus Aminicenantes ba